MGPFLKIRGAFPFPPHPPSHDERFSARDNGRGVGPLPENPRVAPFPRPPSHDKRSLRDTDIRNDTLLHSLL